MNNPSYVKTASDNILEQLKEQYFEPHFPTERNPVGTLNEPFWAGLYRHEHEIFFEPNESQFYEYGGDIYRPVNAPVIIDRLAERLRQVAKCYHQYSSLAALTGNRHLSGVITHLKGQVERADAFKNDQSVLIHVANGVLELGKEDVKKHAFSPQYISRSLIPIEYKKGATCKRFKTELLGLLDEEAGDHAKVSWSLSLWPEHCTKNADSARLGRDWEKYLRRGGQKASRRN